jgi:hypothetical protein
MVTVSCSRDSAAHVRIAEMISAVARHQWVRPALTGG